ncbi:hypothetical protein D3C87_800000 [compost metagenome]
MLELASKYRKRDEIRMEIQLLIDLIRDERGNYYRAVNIHEGELTLVNAFVEASFRVLLSFDEGFRNKYQEYEGGFIGKIPMDHLRHDFVFTQKSEEQGKMYDLDEILKHYKVNYIDTIEFYRHPSMKLD